MIDLPVHTYFIDFAKDGEDFPTLAVTGLHAFEQARTFARRALGKRVGFVARMAGHYGHEVDILEGFEATDRVDDYRIGLITSVADPDTLDQNYEYVEGKHLGEES